MQVNPYVVIMAGGVGSRFWPASTNETPKQFLDITGSGKSLLRNTFDRFLNVVPAERIMILTNMQYAEKIKSELPELDTKNILLEPSRNNTAPCIAYAAFRIQAEDPNGVMLVAPSDHLIEKTGAFTSLVQDGFKFVAEEEAILTLGMRPTRPDTGYGYIQYTMDEDTLSGNSILFKVKKFTEKPSLDNAKRFLASGDYVWNAGIFLFSVKTILNAFESHAKEIYDILEKGAEIYGTSKEAEFLHKNYPQTPDISIDYAIMEKADNIYTLPARIGWSDMGTWASMYEKWEKDNNDSVIQHDGKHLIKDSKNLLLRAESNKKILLRGLENYIIVDTPEALLIYPKDKEQEIKTDRNQLLKD